MLFIHSNRYLKVRGGMHVLNVLTGHQGRGSHSGEAHFELPIPRSVFSVYGSETPYP